VPAAATQPLLERACLLGTDAAFSLDEARLAPGWDCSPSAGDVQRPHVWLRIDGNAIAQGQDLHLQTDTLGFERLITVAELADGTSRVRGYNADDLGHYWTLATTFSVPLLSQDERVERIWLRIDKPLDRNTAALATLETADHDRQKRLYGMVLFAFFCGMLLAVAIYSLSLSVALRSGFALWHGLMVVLFLVYTVSASSLLFMVLPDLTLWQRSATSYLSLALSMAMVAPFFLTFLEPGVLPRWTTRTISAASVLVALSGIGFVLWAPDFPFLARPLYHAAFIPLIVGFAVICPLAWRRGSEAIRLVALAWALPALVAVDRILRGLNVYVLPTEWDYAFYIAMAWQSVVMAAAITWRIGRIRRERDMARAQEQVLGQLAMTDDLTGLPNRPMPPMSGIGGWAGLSRPALDDRRFGGDQQAGDRSRILQRGAHDLGRVDHAGLHQVFVGVGGGVEALGLVTLAQQVARNDRAIMAGVLGDLLDRGGDRLADDVDAAGLVVVGALHAFERLGGIEQRGAAARNDAFFHRSAGRVQRVVDAVLALLHFDFGRAADLDHGHAAGQLGQTLLQLLAVVIAGGGLDLGADLFDARLDVVGDCRRHRRWWCCPCRS
jgi:hypothetical protein